MRHDCVARGIYAAGPIAARLDAIFRWRPPDATRSPPGSHWKAASLSSRKTY